MILVILGAGATYDSDSLRPAPRRGMVSGFDPLRPPLTQDLFDTKYGAILQRHPACLRLVPDLRDAVAAGRPIEPELERLRARAQTTHPTLAAALIALRGYLAEVVAKSEADWADGHKGTTNQLTLVARLEEWREPKDERVRFITFNYDRVLEEAVHHVMPELWFGSPQDYIKDARYRIYKLHGSTDWHRRTEIGEIVNGHQQTRVATKAADTFTSDPNAIRRGGWIPAISIPLATKTDSEFECPDEHLDAMKDDLRQVDSIISIGWRGEEEHFMNLWREHRPNQMAGMLSVASTQETAFAVSAKLTSGVRMEAQSIIWFGGFSGLVKGEPPHQPALNLWLGLASR